VLGDDVFRKQLQANVGKVDSEIPRRKQILRHLPLSEIAQAERARGDWMREAYREHGYTMQEIANFSYLHHSTVSRFIGTGNQQAPGKAPLHEQSGRE